MKTRKPRSGWWQNFLIGWLSGVITWACMVELHMTPGIAVVVAVVVTITITAGLSFLFRRRR